MPWVTLLSIGISIVQGVLAGLTQAKAPQEILDALQQALVQLTTVHGTLVTKIQVDQHTLDYRW